MYVCVSDHEYTWVGVANLSSIRDVTEGHRVVVDQSIDFSTDCIDILEPGKQEEEHITHTHPRTCPPTPHLLTNWKARCGEEW